MFRVERLFGDFFEGGRIVGGDSRYYVIGTYTIEDLRLTGDLEVIHYAGESELASGQGETVRLSISATLDSRVDRDVFTINAVPEESGPDGFRLRLTRRAPLD